MTGLSVLSRPGPLGHFSLFETDTRLTGRAIWLGVGGDRRPLPGVMTHALLDGCIRPHYAVASMLIVNL